MSTKDEARKVTLDDVYESTSLTELLAEARSRDEWCCEVGCGSGGCESCPCCAAGWCVSGRDGLPDDPDDLAMWLEVARDHNPVAAALAAALGGGDQIIESPAPGTLAYAHARAEADGSLDSDEDGYDGPVTLGGGING